MAIFRIMRISALLTTAIIAFWFPTCLCAADTSVSGEDKARFEAISGMSNRQLFDRATQWTDSLPDSALLYFDIIANRYRQSMAEDDARLCAEALLNSGKIFYDNFNYSNAMESLLKCRKVCEDNNFQSILSETYRYIGNIYSRHSDYERAITFYDKSLGIGLFCYEFSHTLGLPDIYDTTNSGSKLTMGEWDVMDLGCYNNSMRTPAGYSSYVKSVLGWIEPELPEAKATGVTLPSLGSEARAIKMVSPSDPDEYFLSRNPQ